MARPTIVMLHALGASGAAWRAVEAALGAGYHCLAPDLPGFGERAGEGDTGIAATLDRLADLIRDRAGGRYLLVGHSMGGKFATLLAAQAAAGDARLEGLTGVVLLAASPPAPEPMAEDRRAEMIGWFTDGPPAEAQARRFVDDNIAGPLPPDRYDQAVADVRRSSPAAWIAWLAQGSREDWADRVGTLAVPAIIAAGAADGDLGEANQRRCNLPHYRNGRLVTVPGAAHLFPYEQPQTVAFLIEEGAAARD